MNRTLSEELTQRGFVHQFSGESLENILDGERRTFYLGTDPTATSLTIGNLAAYMLARHLADAGHTPILLVGGGTGMIGDPGGRDSERKLLDEETLQKNIAGIRAQVEKILAVPVRVVNNADWLGGLNLIEFLRDVGKHFTVNAMVKKDIVKNRLDAENPISYTEFTYSLLQGYDFWYLYTQHGCTLQIAGSDQWTNILAGVDYIKKTEGVEVFGLTNPIIVNPATGKKFGKSEDGALWLDPEQTSPYKLYQYLLNVDDVAVEQLLKIYTLKSLEDIAEIMESQKSNPQVRRAQRELAHAVASFVHGNEQANVARQVSEVLFGDGLASQLPYEAVAMIKESAPVYAPRPYETVAEVLVASGLATSKRDALQLIDGGGVTIDGKVIRDHAVPVAHKTNHQILRKGKKSILLLLPQ